MNAAEIYSIVKDWPKKAWPRPCDYWINVLGSSSFHYGPCVYPDSLAELAFEASGMRHANVGVRQHYSMFQAYRYGTLEDPDGEWWKACPTRLAAIDAAIKGLST